MRKSSRLSALAALTLDVCLRPMIKAGEPSSPHKIKNQKKSNAHVRPTLRGLNYFVPFVYMCSTVAVFHHGKHRHRLFCILSRPTSSLVILYPSTCIQNQISVNPS
ncbi:hypothetical protein V8E52_007378 [Russula decolorans]